MISILSRNNGFQNDKREKGAFEGIQVNIDIVGVKFHLLYDNNGPWFTFDTISREGNGVYRKVSVSEAGFQ